jgi:type VI secretion system protein ImpC
MSTGEQAQAAPEAGTRAVETQEVNLLDRVLTATKQTERSRTEDLMKTLVDQSLAGTLTFDKNVTKTINATIKAIDEKLSVQLGAVMHHPDFQKLEGTWRGLNYLVMNSETSAMLKLKVLNVPKRELFNDVDKAVEFDQSQIFKKLYENEFGTPGGEPYGALIGDYEFTNHPEDIDLLGKISNVAAAAFCPFISAAAPQLFGFESWTELSKPRDLEKIFMAIEYTKWKSFRESEDSRFVSLVMPRTLARMPYGADTKPIEEFGYEEVDASKPVPHENFTWMNAAYVMGTKMTDAFAKYGFCTAIRGAEGGGKVEGLPAFIFTSDDGDKDLKCPTELGITDRREAELSKLGFLPLCHYKNTDYAVFFGGQTAQKAKKYDRPEATANAAISARLPYIMATSRFAHYLKVMARDWIGSFKEASDVESDLNRWIKNYVNSNTAGGQEIRAKFPLRDAKVVVQEIPGQPGSYHAIAWMRPWLQFEELTTSMRMVASIPKSAGG